MQTVQATQASRCPNCDSDMKQAANVQGYTMCVDCGYVPRQGAD